MNRTIPATLAVVALGAGAVLWYATSRPDQTVQAAAPAATGSTAATGGADADAPIVDVALPAELSPEAQLGKRVFETKCAVCHNVNAAGRDGSGPPLVHRFYQPGHHGDAAFLQAVRNGVPQHHWTFGNMPQIEGLTDGDVKYIVRYIREMQMANGI